MLERWLKEGEPTVKGFLESRMLQDGQVEDMDALYGWLGREIARNYVSPGELETIFADLGAPEVAEHLRKNKFPTAISVRNGEFGEALAAALFRRVRRWCVPVLKLRYKQRPNQPVLGADVIAFRLRVDPPLIAVPEVKTRTGRRVREHGRHPCLTTPVGSGSWPATPSGCPVARLGARSCSPPLS